MLVASGTGSHLRAINHAETVVLTTFLLCWEELAVRSKDLGEVRFPGGSQHGAPGSL